MSKQSSSASSSGGVGFIGLLTVAFIVWKLLHVTAWSWVWVLSPLWISAILTILILGVFLIVIVLS
jgi:hypothetical protein